MPESNSKLCKRCACTKPLFEFGPNRGRADGVSVYCRPCTKSYMAGKSYDKDRWLALKEVEQARTARYRALHRDRLREKYRSDAARKRAENPAKIREYNIARKHGERRATPPWADHAAMSAVYQEARRLEALDGVPRHVGHIIPLKHPLVCGLHTHTNLRVVLATENMSKHNRFEIQ